jgi:hypothetical protein
MVRCSGPAALPGESSGRKQSASGLIAPAMRIGVRALELVAGLAGELHGAAVSSAARSCRPAAARLRACVRNVLVVMTWAPARR